MSAPFEPAPYKLTVDAFHALAEGGHLPPDARVELIEGVIVETAPIGWPHDRITGRLIRALVLAVGDRALVSPHGSVPMRPWSEPQPDVIVYPGEAMHRDAQRPASDHLLLVVEVAESSLAFDRGRKAGVYARGGIREYWVVDVAGERVEVRRTPHDGRWLQVSVLRRGETLTIDALPGVDIAVDAVFG